MFLTFDRTNFPLIAVEEVGVEVHLLPVTRWQFEQFVSAAGPLEPARYQELLAVNPTIPADELTADEREQFFVTSILPAEARAFARWLGQGFDAPTVQEWRAIYAALRVTSLPRHDLALELGDSLAGPILAQLSEQLQGDCLVDFSLMRGGLVEWVRQGQTWVGLGAPRPQFHPNLWDPLTHEIKPIHPDERLRYFGFRLIRRGKWYLADREKVRYIE